MILKRLKSQPAQEALDILKEDFTELEGLGPTAASMFAHGEVNDDTRAEARGFVERFARLVEEPAD